MAGMLMTDLYQLTMAQAYWERDMHAEAVFDLFVRHLPASRRFLLAAGLQQAVEYLEAFAFDAAEIAYLESLKRFSRGFLEHLATLQFSGSLLAMAEGTACFAGEPILRVSAPIIEAQLVESRLLNLIHTQTVIASKAVRLVIAARGRGLIDFGMRRAHGAEAALYGARAAYLAGFDASATVQAGERFSVPLSGTMAHSFIEAHDREEQALRDFTSVGTLPTTLLIDTYDTERAAQTVVQLVRERRAGGLPERIAAVRIDSGDLAAQARRVRAILDEGDARTVQIVLSGGLDEHQIDRMVRSGEPADAFGVGTDLIVSADAPALDVAYKLAWYAGQPRRKRSAGKATWPGRKQVFRRAGADGHWLEDCLGLQEDAGPGEPLLQPIMLAGRRLAALPSLPESRQYCREQVRRLPAPLRRLDPAEQDGEQVGYPVRISPSLQQLTAQLDARIARLVSG